MKKFYIIFSFFILPFLFCQASLGLEDSSLEIKLSTQKYILDNGLTVLITEMPSSPVVAVFAFVKTGSATEGEYLGSGISHFLEHMLFKGTHKRKVGDISREIQSQGGVINASTGYDYTVYTITIPPEAVDLTLDVMADMLMNSQFEEEEINKEREVVYGEMRLHKDNPSRYHGERVFQTAFLRHPYGLPIIGFEEMLKKLTREDFLKYYHQHYTPNNIIFSVAGKIKEEDIYPRIKEAFKNFERQYYFTRNVPQEPVQMSSRWYTEEYPTELTRLSMSYPSVSMTDFDMYALDVLAMILGQGESSRLYQDLFKKKGLVQSISASNYTPLDRGIFEIECILKEEDIDKTIQAIKEQIQQIILKGVAPSELAKVKEQVLSQYIFEHETADSVAFQTAMDEAYVGDFNFSKQYTQAIDAITGQDIQRVTRAYLQAERLSVVILKPKAKEKGTVQAPVEEKESEIQKIELNNGLTILLKENHAVPIVSMHVILQGGTRQEDASLNGLSELTSRLWVKGTKAQNATQIAQTVESRGAHLSGFSGKNSFGIHLALLSKDLDFGLNLLEELIKYPTFPEEELGKEKEKLKTAIQARDDQISQMTSQALKKELFQSHSFRLESLGTIPTVEKIQRSDITHFYDSLVSAKNMVLSVFGDIHSTEILEILKKKFTALPQQDVQLVSQNESPPQSLKEKTIFLKKEQAMVMMGFQAASFLDQDRYGLDLLSSILGSPYNGWIFSRVREEFGQAYSLGGGYTPAIDTGMIYFYVLTKEDHLPQVREILINLIEKIKNEGVTQQELQEVKTYLKGTFKMVIQTSSALGFHTGLDELYGLGYAQYNNYDALIDQVTKEDIQRLAQKYLDMNKAVIIMTKPEQDQ